MYDNIGAWSPNHCCSGNAHSAFCMCWAMSLSVTEVFTFAQQCSYGKFT